jgi:hypothetical protein
MTHKLVIDRITWCRGHGAGTGRLFVDAEYASNNRATHGQILEGTMCCLGFACVQLAGKTPENLAGRAVPQGVENTPLAWSDLTSPEFGDANALMEINDDVPGEDLTTLKDEADREAHVARIFAEHGIEVEFIN